MFLLFGALLLAATSDEQNAAAAAGLAAGMFVVFGIVILALLAFQIYCYWRVAVKSGYEGAYSLLTLVPLVNIVILLMWVFSEWPIETELKRYRAAYPPPPAPPVAPAGSVTLPSKP